MTTAQLERLLKARYRPPEYACILQVRNQTGYVTSDIRTADALAMSLWPSRGIELHGFEIKASRTDWVKEKDNPAKAEAIAQYCDRWWLVAADAKFVQPGELPPNWGLLVPNSASDKLVVKQEAMKLVPCPISRTLLCAIMRAACDIQTKPEDIAEAVRLAVESDREAQASKSRFAQTRAERELETLRNRVTAFEKDSGVNIDTYAGGLIGKAVAAVLDLGVEQIKSRIEKLKRDAEKIVADCEVAIGDTT